MGDGLGDHLRWQRRDRGSIGRVAAFGADAAVVWETVLETKAIETLTITASKTLEEYVNESRR